MNEFVLTALILGAISIAAYYGIRLPRRKACDVENAVALFGSTVGFVSGIQVSWVAVTLGNSTPALSGIIIQMFLGGVALSLFAVNAIRKKFTDDP